ncbi:hypothetical protein J5N97_025995 [Dioscorea zingiberensis]|uniref:DUF641 domain-containing protein n=1 Tax=Dioscorea zingiberensis TaxID=325984 RepID=A0A9D5C2E3_9LILI|nr:hypothetical protein J5N97_025995 [Dioscorea zingiberensis]
MVGFPTPNATAFPDALPPLAPLVPLVLIFSLLYVVSSFRSESGDRKFRMETARLAPPKSLKKAFSSILRARRATDEDDATARKLKPSKTLGHYPTIVLPDGNAEDLKEQQKQRKEKECLLDNLFVSISGIKAAYAQLQLAQSPYNPDGIQNADEAVVFQLKHLSQLKHAYLKEQPLSPQPPLSAQIQEQRNLLKTYQITVKKLESELQFKDDEIRSLEAQLLESQTLCSTIDAKLHPNRSLSALRDLHLSGLNPTHFLFALRYTVKSIRHFVKQMVVEMESTRWDLDTAAGAIYPEVLRRGPTHSNLAFESYVSLKMFSDFQCPDYGLRGLDCCGSWDQNRFFDEFSSSSHLSWNQLFKRSPQASEFVRAKYLTLIHPKMEASFFGNLDQRALVSSGRGFPDSEFFSGFAEMARRLWLLHCLFFSFVPSPAIFQAARGARFSDVFMETVVAEEYGGYGTGPRPTVAFTVVPGFKLGRAVIQCRVYLTSKTHQRS